MMQGGSISSTRGLSLRSALVATAIVASLVYWWSAMDMAGPIVMEDELGPFGLARSLVAGGPEPSDQYHPGHAFVLIPALALGRSFESAYQLALVSQALLAGLVTFWLGMIYSKLVSDASPLHVSLVAAAGGFYPAFFADAHLTWTETSVVAVVVAVVAVAVSPRRTRSYAVALGLLAGFSYFFHPRLVVIPIAVVVWAILVRPDLFRGLLGVSAVAGFVLAAGLIQFLQGAPATRRAIATIGGFDLGNTLGLGAGAALTGIVSTAGLVLVVLLAVRSGGVHRSTAVLVSLIWLGLLAAGALFFGRGDIDSLRADQLIYGRYQDAALPAAVVVGLGGLPLMRRLNAVPRLVALALIPGIVALWRLGAGALERPGYHPANVVGLGPLGDRLSLVALVFLALAAAMAPIALARLPDRRFAAVVLLSLFLVVGVSLTYRVLVPSSVSSAAAVAPADLMTSDTADSCLAVEVVEGAWWWRAMYEYRSGVRATIGYTDPDCNYEFLLTDRTPPRGARLIGKGSTGIALYDVD